MALLKRLMFVLLLCVFLGESLAEAQVVINEFSGANYSENQDNYGDYEDWIELYNTSTSPVDIGGYFLSDKIGNPTKWEIPAGTMIGGEDYLVFWCSKRDETGGGNYHTSFKITQTKGGEDIVFAAPDGTIIDSNELENANKKNESTGRRGDGNADWGVLENPSPGAANNNVTKGYTPDPDFDYDAGYYPAAISVVLTSEDPTANIYYTTNGDVPNQSSTPYTGAVLVDETMVIRAVAYSLDTEFLASHIETNTYFIGADQHTLPIVSIAGDEVDDLLNDIGGGGGWGGGAFDAEPIGSFELFDENGAILDEGLGEYNKHGNDSWAYDQRGIDYISRDEFGIDDAVDHEIFETSDRGNFQRLILKGAANDNYPFEDGAHVRDAYIHHLTQKANMNLDCRSNQFCILYTNGEYWGVYEMREKVDDNDFTKYYYDQGSEWIDYIKTWGATWVEYGGPPALASWNNLNNYIINNDMTDESNYEYVTSELDVLSLVDYMIINTHTVCVDWLNYNTGWWRGRKDEGVKWRYTLWDMDATFGHYINYTGIPNESPTADPCDLTSNGVSDPEGHTEMLVSLLENETFHNLYVNRYADLNNTHLSCDYMIDLLDEMVATIEPEMPRQVARWGGNISGWQANVDELRNYILTRCNNITDGITDGDCFEAEDPYIIDIIISPNEGGTVNLNTITPESFPFTGTYFTDVDITMTVEPAEGFVFDYWEVTDDNGNVEIYTDETLVLEIIDSGYTVVVYFVPDGLELIIDVDPPLGGDVSINGTIPASYPFSNIFDEGDLFDLSAIAAAGYEFAYWTANNNILSPSPGEADVSFTINEADEIVAHFTEIVETPSYEVTILIDPAESGEVEVDGTIPDSYPYTITVTEGEELDLSAIAATDFAFDFWELTNGSFTNTTDGNVTFTVNADETIIAHFTNEPSEITIMANPDEGGVVNVDGTAVTTPWVSEFENGTEVTLEAIAAEGYVFSHWESNSTTLLPDDTNGNVSFTVGADDTIVAIFELATYPITVTSSDGGTITLNGELVEGTTTLEITHNDVIEIVANPNNEFTFEGWTGISDNAGNQNVSITVTSSLNIGVAFAIIPPEPPIPPIPPVEPECGPVFVTGFSPNADGHNDNFGMRAQCDVQNYSIKIYDRWGQEVFATTDPNLTWDGTYKGQISPVAVYVWVSRLEIFKDGAWETKELKGNLTLIR